jgi:RHS repeat-associated protein
MFLHDKSGFYLTHYRFYDPGAGRWLNRDPIGEAGGTNLYGYVGGNPIRFVDPFGLEKIILFPPKTSEGAAANAVPDTPGVCVVYAHGEIGSVSPTQNKSDAIDAQGLGKIIRKSKECKPEMPIQLMSCYGGAGGDDSIASKLSKELGVTVNGYDGLVLYRAPLWPFSAKVSPLPGVKNKTSNPPSKRHRKRTFTSH